MTREQLRAYATELMVEKAQKVDYLVIIECAEESEHIGHELDEDDAETVADLISSAAVTISWEES